MNLGELKHGDKFKVVVWNHVELKYETIKGEYLGDIHGYCQVEVDGKKRLLDPEFDVEVVNEN